MAYLITFHDSIFFLLYSFVLYDRLKEEIDNDVINSYNNIIILEFFKTYIITLIFIYNL